MTPWWMVLAGVGDETGTGCDMTSGGRNRIEGKRKQCVGEQRPPIETGGSTQYEIRK